MTKSFVVEAARVVAQLCAFVGVVAGCWHITWVAGVGVLASGLVGTAVQSVGYWRLERDRLLAGHQQPTPRRARNPAAPRHSPTGCPLGGRRPVGSPP